LERGNSRKGRKRKEGGERKEGRIKRVLTGVKRVLEEKSGGGVEGGNSRKGRKRKEGGERKEGRINRLPNFRD